MTDKYIFDTKYREFKNLLMITTHTQLLNALVDKYNLKSYLEIGVNDPNANFNKIICEQKVGVDPSPTYHANGINIKTADEFFELLVNPKTEVIDGKEYNSEWLYHPDIVFIDGLHHADQVKRDFENSLHCLSDNGFILIHDVLPEEEQYTQVPRCTKKWFGNVYQWAMSIGDYADISYKTFNIDCGCMLVWKDKGKKNDADKNLSITYDWALYSTLGRTLMNVTDEVVI